MRPASIVMFERLFLASLALSVVSFIIGYDAMSEQMANEPALRQVGIGSGLMIGSMAVSLTIYLLLWFFIARKASNVAKWILVVFTALGIASLAYAFATAGMAGDLNALLSLAYYALGVAAVVFLFKPDAEAWFKGEWKTDPSAFD